MRAIVRATFPASNHRSSSSSSTSFPKYFIAASTGAGLLMSTPASLRMSIGHLLQPAFKNPRYYSTSFGPRLSTFWLSAIAALRPVAYL